MDDIKHKESNWVLFIEESFGKNTYDTLLMFNNNANNIKRMIELYWNILNLDDILKNNNEISDKELLNLKTYDSSRFNSKNSIFDRNGTCIIGFP